MPSYKRLRSSLRLRLKVAVVSLLGLVLPSACRGAATCDVAFTPTPTLTCYTPTPSTSHSPVASPVPLASVSPISPLPTPTPTAEARDQLRRQLVAQNRLPDRVVEELES